MEHSCLVISIWLLTLVRKIIRGNCLLIVKRGYTESCLRVRRSIRWWIHRSIATIGWKLRGLSSLFSRRRLLAIKFSLNIALCWSRSNLMMSHVQNWISWTDLLSVWMGCLRHDFWRVVVESYEDLCTRYSFWFDTIFEDDAVKEEKGDRFVEEAVEVCSG